MNDSNGNIKHSRRSTYALSIAIAVLILWVATTIYSYQERDRFITKIIMIEQKIDMPKHKTEEECPCD